MQKSNFYTGALSAAILLLLIVGFTAPYKSVQVDANNDMASPGYLKSLNIAGTTSIAPFAGANSNLIGLRISSGPLYAGYWVNEWCFNTAVSNVINFVFGDSNGSMGQFWINPIHDGATPSPNNSEWQITMPGNIAVSPSYQGGTTFGKHMQIGAGATSSTNLGVWIYLQNQVTLANSYGAAQSTIGYSVALSWRASWMNTSVQTDKYPGIYGTSISTNGDWRLRMVSDLAPSGATWLGPGGSVHAIDFVFGHSNAIDGLSAASLVNFTNTDTTRLSTKTQVRPYTNITATSTLSLDFANGVTRYELYTNTATLSAANIGASSGFYEENKMFYIANLWTNNVTITYNTNWTTNGAALPTTIPTGTMLQLTLDAINGTSQSNVLVKSSLVYTDVFQVDVDARLFLGAAAITTSALTNAVNYLVKNAKIHGWWTACDVIYPFVGGTSNSHAINLKNAATFPIVFTSAGVTHNANGITGNGSTGSGLSQFNLSTDGVTYLQNSCHMYMYQGASSITANGAPAGCATATARALFSWSGSVMNWGGINVGIGNAGSIASGGSPQGGFIVIRTNSTSQFASQGAGDYGGSAGDATATTGRPNSKMGLLGRANDSVVDQSWSTANLRGFSLGGGMNNATWQLMRADWEAFQAILSRTAP